jgi:hypothetical protein
MILLYNFPRDAITRAVLRKIENLIFYALMPLQPGFLAITTRFQVASYCHPVATYCQPNHEQKFFRASLFDSLLILFKLKTDSFQWLTK